MLSALSFCSKYSFKYIIYGQPRLFYTLPQIPAPPGGILDVPKLTVRYNLSSCSWICPQGLCPVGDAHYSCSVSQSGEIFVRCLNHLTQTDTSSTSCNKAGEHRGNSLILLATIWYSL